MEWIYPNEDVTVKQLLHQLYILADISVDLKTVEKNVVPYETRLGAIAILLLAYHDRNEKSFSIASTKASKADLKNISAALYRAESGKRLLDLLKDDKLI